jgi:hypothetical protein
MANIFADDSKYSLNLRKMANRAKKDQVIFSNLAESLVEGEVEIDDDDWPKTVKTSIISQASPMVISIHTLMFLGGILKYLYSKRIVAVNG